MLSSGQTSSAVMEGGNATVQGDRARVLRVRLISNGRKIRTIDVPRCRGIIFRHVRSSRRAEAWRGAAAWRPTDGMAFKPLKRLHFFFGQPLRRRAPLRSLVLMTSEFWLVEGEASQPIWCGQSFATEKNGFLSREDFRRA